MNIPQMATTPTVTEQDVPAVAHADRVVRRFGSGAASIVAVRGVTATVAPRARIALTGPSGSGQVHAAASVGRAGHSHHGNGELAGNRPAWH